MQREAHTYVQLCGHFVVELCGRRIEQRFPSRQGRTLFAYLVLQRTRAVGRDELIEAIWASAAPKNHAQALTVLLSKVLDYAAAGEHAPTLAPTFVLAQTEQEPEPGKVLDQLVDFWRQSRARTAPFYKLLRQAAALDQEAADLELARAEERLRSYRTGAALLAERGALREGLSIDDAAAIFHATGHPDVYRFLVIEQKWTAAHWANWVRSTLEAGLLAP